MGRTSQAEDCRAICDPQRRWQRPRRSGGGQPRRRFSTWFTGRGRRGDRQGRDPNGHAARLHPHLQCLCRLPRRGRATAPRRHQTLPAVARLRRTHRAPGPGIVRRAILRGDLPTSANPGLIMDMLVGGTVNPMVSTPRRLRRPMLEEPGCISLADGQNGACRRAARPLRTTA